ncbi:hypothetical protein [Streptomyces sp. enrichment culture]|uniref:hypothetical protein n=1 Tax=Streptomyces sp. enrichment culture TaxID=1795815 RepID=UPI003F569571
MKRRASEPAPAVPGCAECARLRNEKRAAQEEHDHSRALDCHILLGRHHRDVHGVAR